MATETCTDCGTAHDPDAVTLPNPIPDLMCAVCGTQLTEEQVAALAPPLEEQP